MCRCVGYFTMTAVSAVSLSTTQLNDLPGNKITSQKERPKPPTTKSKAGLVMHMRAAPSDHFISARGGQNERLVSFKEHAKESAKTSSVAKTIKAMPYAKGKDPLRSCIPFNYDSTRRESAISLKCESHESSSETSDEEDSDDDSTIEHVPQASGHNLNKAKEKRLLESLMQVDDEEDDKLLRIQLQTDEDIYQMWRRAGAKTTEPGTRSQGYGNNKINIKATPPPPKTGSNAVRSYRGRKTCWISGWDSFDSIACPPRSKVEAKPKTTAMNASRPLPKYVNDRNLNEPTYLFFHYTDIKRYIEQYRSQHVCEDLTRKYSNFNQTVDIFPRPPVIRESNYQVKFDLQPTDHRYRLVPPTAKFIGNVKYHDETSKKLSSEKGFQDKASQIYHQQIAKAPQTDPSLMRLDVYKGSNRTKSPTSESWASNSDKSVQQKLNNHMKNIRKQIDERRMGENKEKTGFTHQSNSNQYSLSGNQGALADMPARVGSQRNYDRKFHNSPFPAPLVESWEQVKPESNDAELFAKIMHANSQVLENAPTRSNDSKLEIPYQTTDKCFAVQKVHKLRVDHKGARKTKFNQNAQKHMNLLHQNVILQEDYFPENENSDGKYQFSNEQLVYETFDNSRNGNFKNNRMKSLIAAEIYNLQQRKIITSEQRKKLHKFRLALSNMSYHPNKAVPTGQQCNSATRRVIAGSIRAFYSKTTQEDHLAEQKRLESAKSRETISLQDAEDNQPIIVVSQPHLRQFGDESRNKLVSPLISRPLIGGKPVEKRSNHPADAKQFTRITDLLQVRKRQRSHSATGSRAVSAVSVQQRHNSASSSNSNPRLAKVGCIKRERKNP
ncbi:uncharacterized protein LOC143469789 [Clavelina lepadiformis]|uniref:uncharacterized protein LOC143469789 n=1 Tax=Clavelina lepadiformis TaxID=159417 RepID=UPI004041EEF1